MADIYLEHPTHKGYCCNISGDIRNAARKSSIKGYMNNGYRLCTLGSDTRGVRFHRFVYECFKGEIPKGCYVCHINGNTLDNSVTNLEVVPVGQNARPASVKRKRDTSKQHRAVSRHADDGTVTEFSSLTAAAEQSAPATASNIIMCLNGKRSRAGGYRWTVQQEEDLEGEEWRAIDGITVSNLGRAKGIRGHILDPWKTIEGYKKLTVNNTTVMLHKLICRAFHGPCPAGCSVDHINRCRADNISSNLRWATHVEQRANSALYAKPV